MDMEVHEDVDLYREWCRLISISVYMYVCVCVYMYCGDRYRFPILSWTILTNTNTEYLVNHILYIEK